MLVCKKCKAVKIEDKWIPSSNLRRNVNYTLCPNCSQELKQTIHGTLLIDGTFFNSNPEQALQVIKSEEMRARKNNVYSRIVQIVKNRVPVLVKTTNSQLAIQIGKQFKRQFKGQLDISTSKKNGVMVRWSSEAETAEAVKESTPRSI
jgi:NMD protein affecting ribosome stability and mRNA decay